MNKIYKWSVLATTTLSLVACGAGAQKTNS